MIRIKNWNAIESLHLIYDGEKWECYQSYDWDYSPILYKKTKIVYRALFRSDSGIIFMNVCENGYVELKLGKFNVADEDILTIHINKLVTTSPANFLHSLSFKLETFGKLSKQ